MKKILVSKKTWACLCDIKKRLKFNGISKVVDYLVDSEQILLGENSHKTDDLFSIEKNSGFHEEKYVEKHPFDSELGESIEFKVDRVLKGENGHKKADPVSLKKNSGFIEEKKALNDIYAFLDGKKDE